MAAKSNEIPTLVPFRDRALESFITGLLQASVDYGRRPIGEFTAICGEAANLFQIADIPNVVSIIWDLMFAVRRLRTRVPGTLM